MDSRRNKDCQNQKKNISKQEKMCGRREFLKGSVKAAALGGAVMASGCGNGLMGSKEEMALRFQEYFKRNYRLMTQEEKDETVRRLERLAKLKRGVGRPDELQRADRRRFIWLCLQCHKMRRLYGMRGCLCEREQSRQENSILNMSVSLRWNTVK